MNNDSHAFTIRRMKRYEEKTTSADSVHSPLVMGDITVLLYKVHQKKKKKLENLLTNIYMPFSKTCSGLLQSSHHIIHQATQRSTTNL